MEQVVLKVLSGETTVRKMAEESTSMIMHVWNPFGAN